MTGHTRESLERLQATVRLVNKPVVFRDVPESQRLLMNLGATRAAAQVPATAVLEAVRQRLRQEFVAGRTPNPTRRDLRDAPWILWNGKSPGAAFPGLLDAVVTQAGSSRRLLRSLIEAWLGDFKEDDKYIAAGAFAIEQLLSRTDDFALATWQSAHAAHRLFDVREGPKRLAGALIAGQATVTETLTAVGMDDPLRAAGGFMRAVLLQGLALAPNALRGAAPMACLARLLEALVHDGALRFGGELRGCIGRGLLAAWLDGGRAPAAPLRDPIQSFLLRHLGDPRLNAPAWTPVGEAGTALMKQWLARTSLKAFFDIIAEHAYDRHWRYREAFWSACLDQGAIDDAWLALGSRARLTARSVGDLAGAYGRLDGSGGDQSVLLLRIGPLILCEWSHNGKLRAWLKEWKQAPALHRPVYSRGDLTLPGLPFPPNARFGSIGSSDNKGLSHFSSERDNWQGSAAELLARKANVHLTPEQWRPR